MGIGTKIFLGIISFILFIALMIGISFGAGWLKVGYKNTVGMADATADRNIFEQNKSYVQGMISDLSNYKYEYETSKDEISKKAIANLIREKYANFDINKIENFGLQQFLVNILNGNV